MNNTSQSNVVTLSTLINNEGQINLKSSIGSLQARDTHKIAEKIGAIVHNVLNGVNDIAHSDILKHLNKNNITKSLLRGISLFKAKSLKDKAFVLWRETILDYAPEYLEHLQAIMFNEGGWKAPTFITVTPTSKVYGYFQFTKGTWEDRVKLVKSIKPSVTASSLTFTFGSPARPIVIDHLHANDAVFIAEMNWGSKNSLSQVIPCIVQSFVLIDNVKRDWTWTGTYWSYKKATKSQMATVWNRLPDPAAAQIALTNRPAGLQFILTCSNIQGLNWFSNITKHNRLVELHAPKRLVDDFSAYLALVESPNSVV